MSQECGKAPARERRPFALVAARKPAVPRDGTVSAGSGPGKSTRRGSDPPAAHPGREPGRAPPSRADSLLRAALDALARVSEARGILAGERERAIKRG
jgi:hypothetical protein